MGRAAAGRPARPCGGSAGGRMVERMEPRLTALRPRLEAILGADGVITDPVRLRTYECDGLTNHRATPGIVVLPGDAEQVAAVVRECAAAGVPYVARGSGRACPAGRSPAWTASSSSPPACGAFWRSTFPAGGPWWSPA